MRRPGSAALDLAFLAAGRVDAYYEIGLHPWDVAAGWLLVTEAGGRVGSYRPDGPYHLGDFRILATNGRLHPAMMDSSGAAIPVPAGVAPAVPAKAEEPKKSVTFEEVPAPAAPTPGQSGTK